ncbi:MAG: diacylglycerol/lipid kinase family protein [Planctomycetaceae bacterium]
MPTSPFGPLAVIADPHAGEGAVGRALPSVQRALASSGLEHRLAVAETAEHATRLAAEAIDEGYRYLCAVGDDATVHAIVNGMFRDGRPIVEEAVLAVIPAGSGCDLVKSFGLPGDVEESATHLLGDVVYDFDVMKVAVTARAGGGRTIRYAHNLAEVGFHAVSWSRATRLPRRLGGARRFLGFWSAYVTERVRDVHLETDTRSRDLRTWSVIVGNAQFADGGLRMSPRSFPGDGVLDALVFTGPKSDAYRMLPRLFRHGGHVPDDDVAEFRARLKVSVDADRPMPVVADGIRIGTTPVTFQLLPQAIRIKL